MSTYKNQEVDYNDFVKRNYLKTQFDLRQLNLVPSVAETD